MRKVVALAIIVASSFGLLFAKPMEALSRYNVVLVHGAAPESQGFESTCDNDIRSAWNLGDAAGMLGHYENKDGKKLTYWLDSIIFEDTVMYGSEYIYIQRSFTNPANSSLNNAYELGSRTWNRNNERLGHRRSLMEEAQEVKAVWYDAVNDSTHTGQAALELIRRNPDRYRQLASRYILIGHSMGGVVSREYVQGNFYNGDVDKIITLDSPHEGTGALNMQLGLLLFCSEIRRKRFKENRV